VATIGLLPVVNVLRQTGLTSATEVVSGAGGMMEIVGKKLH
jgi:hypothetical protein